MLSPLPLSLTIPIQGPKNAIYAAQAPPLLQFLPINRDVETLCLRPQIRIPLGQRLCRQPLDRIFIVKRPRRHTHQECDGGSSQADPDCVVDVLRYVACEKRYELFDRSC